MVKGLIWIYFFFVFISRNRFNSLFQSQQENNNKTQEVKSKTIEKRLVFRNTHGSPEPVDDTTDGVEASVDEEEAPHSGEVTDETSTSIEEKGLMDESLVTHFNDSICELTESDVGSESSNKILESSSGSQKKYDTFIFFFFAES